MATNCKQVEQQNEKERKTSWSRQTKLVISLKTLSSLLIHWSVTIDHSLHWCINPLQKHFPPLFFATAPLKAANCLSPPFFSNSQQFSIYICFSWNLNVVCLSWRSTGLHSLKRLQETIIFGVATMYFVNLEISQKPLCLILTYWLTKFTNADYKI